jgi:hypothetical protein
MTERDLSDQPSTDHQPATDAPVVAGAGESFDALDSTTPLTVGSDSDSDSDKDSDEVSGADDADRGADD